MERGIAVEIFHRSVANFTNRPRYWLQSAPCAEKISPHNHAVPESIRDSLKLSISIYVALPEPFAVLIN